METPITLGVSACLLGEKVRYDGGHKLDHFVTDMLGRFVRYVPVCPEVEVGLGVPREPMRLVDDPGHPDRPRLKTVRTGIDHTEAMRAWAERRVGELAREGLSGFIFKAKSPSSGMARVKVYNAKGVPRMSGVGLFAEAFMRRFPLLPVEDEGRLNDEGIRENFIERVFATRRWQDLKAAPSPGGLVEFHARHKLLVMAHSPVHYRRLGALVATAGSPGEKGFEGLLSEYEQLFAEALALKSTPKKHVNVLMHIMGYFKKVLTADEKREFLEVLERYAAGDLPLIVPITLANHYVRLHDQPYLGEQHYLCPHPLELRLRNHA